MVGLTTRPSNNHKYSLGDKGNINSRELQLRWRKVSVMGNSNYTGVSRMILGHWRSNCYLKTGSMAQYSGIKADVYLSVHHAWQSLCCIRSFYAVHCRGKSRLKVWTSMTWGIRWLASAEVKDGERGGRFPTVRQEHLFGLIGRSHFPPKTGGRNWGEKLAWLGARKHNFHVICKKESRITESGGNIIYI